ncbi:sodium:solute symporter family protein [Kiritimatiella glycovorans]|uniref:Putative symporter YidK n=1 Tax=Kiritimatiella glycovorans TaxID=1307763 RepID=A0A0G3ELW0_9BACT|nr:sodium:solute symporter family protein [Kiritimatiella glycovorans]AKJ65149.1 putative symporter YidK [Kiritimatiella glycovorans]
MWLGLDYAIWCVVLIYLLAMLALGWWSRGRASSQDGYLMGERKFNTPMMIMHSFGAGTNPGDAAGVVSGSTQAGASGVWVSWLWMYGTPFYWLIAPMVRRMRCLTMADYFEERFGGAASALYILVSASAMVVCLASVLLATTKTVQGMMGRVGTPDAELWFYGILIVTTLTFMLYSYWGGIVAAIRTDFIQGLMMIVLSFLVVPVALNLETVGGIKGMQATLAAASREHGTDLLSIFGPDRFNLGVVLMLCMQAPLSAMALPHLATVCGAGKTEWQGRMGFAGGNMLKRFCTIGWALLGMAWLAHLISQGVVVDAAVADAAFGDAIRALLPPVLQGVMLACILAAAMSSGNAFQVTVAGLFSENLYKRYVNPSAGDLQKLRVTKTVGLIYVLLAVLVAILMRDVVQTIMTYFTILALVGISTAMGMLWRRMNQTGMMTATLLAVAVFAGTRLNVFHLPSGLAIGAPIAAGVIGGIVGSLLSRPPDREKVDRFFTKIYTPVGQEDKLGQSLDEAVPADRRWLTAGGLFVVKPSRQSWVGFLAFFGLCMASLWTMLALLGG